MESNRSILAATQNQNARKTITDALAEQFTIETSDSFAESLSK